MGSKLCLSKYECVQACDLRRELHYAVVGLQGADRSVLLFFTTQRWTSKVAINDDAVLVNSRGLQIC